MAKTSPIGVRFDKEALELVKKERKLDSPQKVLNWLFDHYRYLPKEFKKEEQPKQPPPKPNGKWDFSGVLFFQIEDFTEYPKGKCPSEYHERLEFLAKKKEADDKIRAAWFEFKQSKTE